MKSKIVLLAALSTISQGVASKEVVSPDKNLKSLQGSHYTVPVNITNRSNTTLYIPTRTIKSLNMDIISQSHAQTNQGKNGWGLSYTVLPGETINFSVVFASLPIVECSFNLFDNKYCNVNIDNTPKKGAIAYFETRRERKFEGEYAAARVIIGVDNGTMVAAYQDLKGNKETVEKVKEEILSEPWLLVGSTYGSANLIFNPNKKNPQGYFPLFFTSER